MCSSNLKMKTHPYSILLFLFIVLVNCRESFSQLIKSYGLKGAATFANQMFDYSQIPNSDTKPRVGFNVGGYMEWFHHPVFSILTEFEYVQRGMRETLDVTDPSGPTVIGQKTFDNRLDYLSFPLLAKISLAVGALHPFLVAGPRVDILLGYKSGPFNMVYHDFKKSILGGSVGLGFETKTVIQQGLSLEVRYNFDLGNSYESEFLKVWNQSIDIWLGIQLSNEN